MSNAKTPDSADLASKDSTSKKSTDTKKERGPVIRYSTVRWQKAGDALRQAVLGVTDSHVIDDLKAVDAAEVTAQASSAALTQAIGTHGTCVMDHDSAEAELEDAALAVAGVLRATARGREFMQGCKGTHPELTARNLISKVPGSGHSVPAELMTTLKEKADAESAERVKLNAAVLTLDSATASFMTDRNALKLSVKRLNATWIAYRMGKGIPTRAGRPKKKAEPSNSESTTPPPAETTTAPGDGASNGANGVHATA